MNKERFNVEEHTTLDGRIIDVFPVSHRYIHELEQQCKKQKEVIDKAIESLNNPWSFESGNKEVDEITYNKKRKVIDILKEAEND